MISFSGEIEGIVLNQSSCEVLSTDVYSGYKRAIRETNEVGGLDGSKKPIATAYCNAYARRGFNDGNEVVAINARRMVEGYSEIYKLEAEAKGQAPEIIASKRKEVAPHFELMLDHAKNRMDQYSIKSSLGRALNYFIENYEGLTYFLDDPDVPNGNNASERILRPHVVGRKRWYGTHSIESAKAAAIHFSLIQSCKLIGLNPRTFYTETVERIHAGKPPLTPKEMALELAHLQSENSS